MHLHTGREKNHIMTIKNQNSSDRDEGMYDN